MAASKPHSGLRVGKTPAAHSMTTLATLPGFGWTAADDYVKAMRHVSSGCPDKRDIAKK